MSILLTQVDSFTNEIFAGNPAAVCVREDQPLSPELMQKIAREMNLSETAFLHPEGDGWSLRWFTPNSEVDLCGHATLAATHVLHEEGRIEAGETVAYSTRSGILKARVTEGGIEMDFPSQPPLPTEAPQGLLDSLAVKPTFVGRSKEGYWLLELETEQDVRACQPDFTLLEKTLGRDCPILSAPSEEPGVDYMSRFFAPYYGVPEDPVTGSAHCTSGPYWAEKLGKKDLVAFQASERGGRVRVGVRGERTLLTGTAVTVMDIQLRL